MSLAKFDIEMKLDLQELKAQKRMLLNLPVNSDIDGLLNLIDYIQDCAVEAGYSEEEVFGIGC